MLADAAEEIGLAEADLEGFCLVAVVVSDDTGLALVVYRAKLREGAEPEPNFVKVAELFWAASPADLGAQASADTVACWEALELWRDARRPTHPSDRLLRAVVGAVAAGDLLPPVVLAALQLALNLGDVREQLVLLLAEALLQVGELLLPPFELVLADLDVGLGSRSPAPRARTRESRARGAGRVASSRSL